MSTQRLLVDHAGLEQASADLTRAVRAIDDRMNRLEQELAPLRSDWTGHAQQSYQQAKTAWDGALAEMRDLLAATSRTVSSSNEEYRAADRRCAATFEF